MTTDATTIELLTPPGTGAIACIAMCGPNAGAIAQKLFRPASGKPLVLPLKLGRFWFGNFGAGVGDEVVLLATAEGVEVHCHGGRTMIDWLFKQCIAEGCVRYERSPDVVTALARARTVRTAAILLDQFHGAFNNSIAHIVEAIDANDTNTTSHLIQQLCAFANLGRHLIAPWRVVVAGVPNAGKSTLINAISGFERSVVSPTPGTTRDVVTALVALDGWPFEFADTAGLRGAAEPLEAEGIAKVNTMLEQADLIVWLIDREELSPTRAESLGQQLQGKVLEIVGKSDLGQHAVDGELEEVSAKTGAGIPSLLATIVRRLIPYVPASGAAVPYTPELADTIVTAGRLVEAGKFTEARLILVATLSQP